MPDRTKTSVRTSMGPQRMLPGLAATFLLAAGAMAIRQMSGIAALSPMLVAMLAGLGVRLALGPEAVPRPGLAFSSRSVLRAGIVLLGLQVTIGDIVGLGAPAFVVAALTLAATYVAIVAMARMLAVPVPLARLIAAGSAVCGASAVVAANSVARGSEEDVAYAVASVTLFGTIAMLVLPLLPVPLGLDAVQYGIWTGASIHEVAQVAVAAFQLGPEAGQAGTIAKLIRVMLLAPLVLMMTLAARQIVQDRAAENIPFPWFVLGFVAIAGMNSLVSVPPDLRQMGAHASTLLMSMGLAAIGMGMDLRQLHNKGAAPLLLGAFGCVFVVVFGLVAVKVLM